MDRYITHATHLRPWKLGMLFDELRRGAVDLAHGLADDLDIANNDILKLLVALKSFEVRYGLKVPYRPFNGFRNVFQVIFDAP